MASLVDHKRLPPASAPRGEGRIVMSGRLARVYGYASLAGPALFAGAADQAKGMLDLAIAACRDPQPGSDGDALEQIGAALIAARALLDVEGAARPAIDLLFRAVARTATEPPEPASATAQTTPRARDALARAGQGS
jgi:hypothetical protein